MKIAIISDIHANLAALEAFPEKNYDQLWCLGDLVDYGPRPHEVIQWIRNHATAAVRGNHDHAVGFGVDPQCSLPYKHLASETMRYTQRVCTKDDFAFLRDLPIQKKSRDWDPKSSIWSMPLLQILYLDIVHKIRNYGRKRFNGSMLTFLSLVIPTRPLFDKWAVAQL